MVDSAREVATLYGAFATGSTDDVLAKHRIPGCRCLGVFADADGALDLIRAAVGRVLRCCVEKTIDFDIDGRGAAWRIWPATPPR